MAKNEKSLSERMADLEDKIDYLIYSEKPQHEPALSETEFRKFYSGVERYLKRMDVLGGRITINERFENVLKHKALYPDYDSGYWFPIGKATKDIPIDFRKMRHDFCIETLDAGNFPPTDRIEKEVFKKNR